ncbi:MAG TPA: DNA-3-methyladenine glycosylase I [Acidimicrobiales bacterium]|nr:DNA-3-methyladenine glycosylase I [Acidimicrobiales bacterium]
MATPSNTTSTTDTIHDGRPRCGWVSDDPLYVRYHDDEWGVPVHDDAALFEMLTLEGAQAGLSWLTVLRRREGYRRAFKNFNPRVVAKFDAKDVERIMLDEGVVRHRQKIESVLNNAGVIVALQETHGTFDAYLWSLGSGAPHETSSSMSKQLQRDGFKFVGATICHSLRQATGMVNDHERDCFRRREIETLAETRPRRSRDRPRAQR